jgi:hypothetical protein
LSVCAQQSGRKFGPDPDGATLVLSRYSIIDGFQSPHGLELLATVDWLNRETGVALEDDAMMAAIASWPGPDGAAERKARIFTRHHVNAGVTQLRETRRRLGTLQRPA